MYAWRPLWTWLTGEMQGLLSTFVSYGDLPFDIGQIPHSSGRCYVEEKIEICRNKNEFRCSAGFRAGMQVPQQ